MTTQDDRSIAVTGAAGFVGQNLVCRLREAGFSNIAQITRQTEANERRKILSKAKVIFHLAGVNRPQDPSEFVVGNVVPAKELAEALLISTARPLVIVASSTKALDDTPYGKSKREAEEAFSAVADKAVILIYRLPNVFGKWSKPNYNSGIATFCYNLARGLPIQVNADAKLTLCYVDDVIDEWISKVSATDQSSATLSPRVFYETTVGEVASVLQGFAASRQTGFLGNTGTGLARALYATYLSFIPPNAMAYPIKSHTDPRGAFSEVLRTGETGQFSYFTAHPGVTRGGHYHHSKTEKFLVLQGTARFRFRQILSEETRELFTDGQSPMVVETIPGWSHDITNVGEDELICMLWANELYDPVHPDTIAAKVF